MVFAIFADAIKLHGMNIWRANAVPKVPYAMKDDGYFE